VELGERIDERFEFASNTVNENIAIGAPVQSSSEKLKKLHIDGPLITGF
jgi:hypothetical protein